MMSSTGLHRFFKVLSVAGTALNIVAMVLLFIYGLAKGSVEAWMPFWIVFSVGIPLNGILYETVKVREYQRDLLEKLTA